MATIYEIRNGETTLDRPMSLSFEGCLVRLFFFDGAGAQVTPGGASPVVSHDNGLLWLPMEKFSANTWTFNGPCKNVLLSLAGVTGYTTYRAEVWRSDDPIDKTPDGLYSGTRAITTQPYTEANVKNGLQYNLRAVWPLLDTIAAATSRRLFFRTTSKPVIVKLREVSFSAEELVLELFQSPTGVTGGTALTIHNYNGVNPVATTAQATKNVSVTTDGTPFDNGDPEYFFGSANAPQRPPSSIPQGRERILPANSTFLVKITNTGTGAARVQYFLDWYEGTTDLPI